MYKKSTSVLSIVANSFSIFFEKLPSFLKYLAYPVLGQLAGVMVCFAPFLISPNPDGVSIPLVLICMIAGLVLFCHAFWKYLLVAGGLVLISRQIIENEPLQEFSRYTDIFSKRSKEYIVFILIASFLIPILLFLVAFAAFFVFVVALKGANFGITLPPEIVSQISAIIVQKGYSINVSSFINILVLIFFGLVFGAVVFTLISAIFWVSMEAFVLNPNLSPTESILKGAKLSIKNYFPNFGLLLILFIIGFVIGQILDLIIISPMFNPALYEKYNAYRDIISVLRVVATYTFASILVPFSVLCRTWWYLRMEKEYTARALRRD